MLSAGEEGVAQLVIEEEGCCCWQWPDFANDLNLELGSGDWIGLLLLGQVGILLAVPQYL